MEKDDYLRIILEALAEKISRMSDELLIKELEIRELKRANICSRPKAQEKESTHESR